MGNACAQQHSISRKGLHGLILWRSQKMIAEGVLRSMPGYVYAASLRIVQDEESRDTRLAACFEFDSALSGNAAAVVFRIVGNGRIVELALESLRRADVIC